MYNEQRFEIIYSFIFSNNLSFVRVVEDLESIPGMLHTLLEFITVPVRVPHAYTHFHACSRQREATKLPTVDLEEETHADTGRTVKLISGLS